MFQVSNRYPAIPVTLLIPPDDPEFWKEDERGFTASPPERDEHPPFGNSSSTL